MQPQWRAGAGVNGIKWMNAFSKQAVDKEPVMQANEGPVMQANEGPVIQAAADAPVVWHTHAEPCGASRVEKGANGAESTPFRRPIVR